MYVCFGFWLPKSKKMKGKKLKRDRERESVKKWVEIWIEKIYLWNSYESRRNEEEKENKTGRPRERERNG